MKNRYFLALTLGLVVLLGAAAQAKAEDCEQDPVYEKSLTGQTTVGSRLRERACMENSSVLTVMPQNAKINIIAETDGWYKVKYGDKTGWVGSRLIKVVGQGNTASVEQVETAKPAKKQAVKIDKKKVIGVSEQNYSKLKNGWSSLVKQLKNKVIMRVQSLGQLYYVDSDGKMQQLSVDKLLSYLDDYADKELVLKGSLDGNTVKLNWTANGIAAENGYKVVMSKSGTPTYPGSEYHYLSDPKASSDSWKDLDNGAHFFRVCVYKDGGCTTYSNVIKLNVTGKPATTPTKSDGKIQLSGSIVDNKANLIWTMTGMESPLGFKVVVKDGPDPVYPGNDYHYLSDPKVRTDVWSGLESGKTYYFRVCEYLGGKCGVYSNNLIIKMP